MKKLLMAAVALICMTLVCVSFSSCGSDDDGGITIISYSAKGVVTGSGTNSLDVFAAVSYNDTIAKTIGGSYCTTSKDAEVKAACDKLYETQRAKYSSWEGTVTITKYVQGSDGSNKETTVIATYTFN